MPPRSPSRFWRKCRIGFRRFRISVLLLILALLSCVLYLNQIGLPDFAKRQLQETLRARGLDLEFTRLRWHLTRGIVAENVRFGPSDQTHVKFFAKEAQMELDYPALAHFRLQVNGLILRAGNFTWELDARDEPARRLSVENIQTELRLLPGDLWRLDNFQAQFAGAHLQFGGVITNASLIRDWQIFHPDQPGTPDLLENRLRELVKTLEQVHFTAPPEFNLNVSGDARDLQSFTMHLNVNTTGAETPWGTVQQAFLSIALLPDVSNALSRAEVNLEAESGQTPWASATNLVLKLNLISSIQEPLLSLPPAGTKGIQFGETNQLSQVVESFSDTNIIDAQLSLSAASVATRWSQAGRVQLAAQWRQAMTNEIPLSGTGELTVENPRTKWADARQLRLTGNFEPATNQSVSRNETWAAWTNLAPLALNWNCAVQDLQATNLHANEIAFAGRWRAPQLIVTNFSSTLYGGILKGDAELNLASGQLKFNAAADLDPKVFSTRLPEKSRAWLDMLAWTQPPQLQLSGVVPLPAWTNLATADWLGEVGPASRFEGHFEVLSSSVHGLQFNYVQSHFSYSNQVWRLADFLARGADGELRLALVSNEATRDFSFKIYSTLDPLALKPLLQTNQYRLYDYVSFTHPPVIDGEILGRWNEPNLIGGHAHLAVTNFSIQGQTMGDLVSTVRYTNRFLTVIEPRAHRGTVEHGSATGLGLDFVAHKIYLTNGVGVADPMAVARAVGPNIAAHIEPYHFFKPVAARVEGTIPMHDPRDADLHFDLDGGPFEWWKFKVAHLTGRVDWVGETLALKQIQTEFYGGTAAGNAHFNFTDHEHGTKFGLNVDVSDAELHLLMSDLSEKTNRLEGLLTASLTITEANSSNLHTVKGGGRVNLRDGLIWEIPIFGILTPALDKIAPGVGSARASEGSATFVIDHGVARSDDLEIRSAVMRLQYWGTLDLVSQAVNARAQAEPLRDVWAIGRILSFALWPVSKIFEYKITGTMSAPKSEPAFFIPKVVLMPFHPFRTLKELLPESPGSRGTNSPPNFP